MEHPLRVVHQVRHVSFGVIFAPASIPPNCVHIQKYWGSWPWTPVKGVRSIDHPAGTSHSMHLTLPALLISINSIIILIPLNKPKGMAVSSYYWEGPSPQGMTEGGPQREAPESKPVGRSIQLLCMWLISLDGILLSKTCIFRNGEGQEISLDLM